MKHYALNHLDLYNQHFSEISSTQLYCLEHVVQLSSYAQNKSIFCVTADQQISGIGKYNATWSSPIGNFYSTYLVKLEQKLSNTELVQGTAVSVSQVLDSLGVQVQIKWVNDLLINGKKIAGILCNSIDLDDKNYVAIGIGVNLLENPDQIHSTSIKKETGIEVEKHAFMQNIALQLNYNLNQEAFSNVVQQYRQRIAYKNMQIECLCEGNSFSGILVDVNPNGYLQVKTQGGIVELLNCKISLVNG